MNHFKYFRQKVNTETSYLEQPLLPTAKESTTEYIKIGDFKYLLNISI